MSSHQAAAHQGGPHEAWRDGPPPAVLRSAIAQWQEDAGVFSATPGAPVVPALATSRGSVAGVDVVGGQRNLQATPNPERVPQRRLAATR